MESQCEVRTTPLRAYNANVGILYVALSVIVVIYAWFNSTKVGAATFDTNVYRLAGHYSGNTIVPPAGTSSLVTLTPMGTGLALLGATILGALFHFVYALDCRRLYTLLVVDRCNGMRWAQYALIHTILALIVAQLTGTTTFDFLMFGLLALPVLGVLGYFADKSYPCCPHMMNVVFLGTAILFVAYWIPVMTNFIYRYIDATIPPPVYMWIALISFLLYDIFVFLAPWIQSRSRVMYLHAEIAHSMSLVIITTIIVICVGWALTDQTSI